MEKTLNICVNMQCTVLELQTWTMLEFLGWGGVIREMGNSPGYCTVFLSAASSPCNLVSCDVKKKPWLLQSSYLIWKCNMDSLAEVWRKLLNH